MQTTRAVGAHRIDIRTPGEGAGQWLAETCHNVNLSICLGWVTQPLSKVRAAARIFHTSPWENKATRNKLPAPQCKHTHTPACEQASLPPSTHAGTFCCRPVFRRSPHGRISTMTAVSNFICLLSELNDKEEQTCLFMLQEIQRLKQKEEQASSKILELHKTKPGV